MACGVLLLTVGAVVYFHYSQVFLLVVGLLIMGLCLIVWLKDVTRESTFQGYHTKAVVAGLKFGFLLFIISEVLFFFSFF